MMWKTKPKRDPYGWRSKFAFWPKRIGDCRIWLERYEVRNPDGDECMRRYPKAIGGPHLYILKEFRTAQVGSAWQLKTLNSWSFRTIETEWVEVKPDLRLVG